MKKNQTITNKNKTLIKNFWYDFISKYKINLILALILLIVVAATASIYPYLIQLVFDGLLDDNSDWITFPFVIAVVAIVRGAWSEKGGAWSLLGQGLARGLDRMGHDWMPEFGRLANPG